MKTIKDFICGILFEAYVVVITTGVYFGLYWYTFFGDLLDKANEVNEYLTNFGVIAIVVIIYNIAKKLVWKAIRHFND